MCRTVFLILTALTELGAGILLMFLPTIPFTLLLGLSQPTPETILVGRVAGAALLAIGVASWLARNDQRSAALFGLLVGILIYDAAAAALLADAGFVLGMTGIALWPAVVIHATLAVWALACLRAMMRGSGEVNTSNTSASAA